MSYHPLIFFFTLIFEIFKRIDSWPSTWSISESKPWVLVKNAHSLVVALKRSKYGSVNDLTPIK